MPKKRRRPPATRGVAEKRREGGENLLSRELRQELGSEDTCNCLVVAQRSPKRRERVLDPPVERDRKKDQAQRKKTQAIVMEDVYTALQQHALPHEEFEKLRAVMQKRKRKERAVHEVADEPESVNEMPMDVPGIPEKPSELTLPSLTEDIPVALEMPFPVSPEKSKTSDQVPQLKKSEGSVHRVRHVCRKTDVETCRSALPILGYEQEIMETVTARDIVVICGQTGCGKTTQVPQFLYEAGYGSASFSERAGQIGVTQPRRIAATSTAARVAHELDVPLGSLVGFQIRHKNRTSAETAIRFMTDGILIRELQRDFLLSAFSALIIDEAHERSLNTDLILGMLSRVVKLRRRVMGQVPLKVIIMSATLEATAFLSNALLFSEPPPVLHIPSRQFSVTIHFSKRTEVEDYETVVLRKVCRIHRQLPPGGILVFMTGKREIDRFCAQLKKQLKKRKPVQSLPSTEPTDVDDIDDATSEEEIETVPGNTEDPEMPSQEMRCQDVMILPLYAMLPPHQQSQVFQPLPEGHRLIVVATNVAETSITIPGIRYVVDCGRAKKKVLHADTGVSRFAVDWISKAAATQRAGRAGRTLPGHCYRIYSSAHFGQRFPEFELPEISCIALEDVVLLMKSMDLHKVAHFPFPSPPDPAALEAAEETLVALGALDRERCVTAMGRQMIEFPIGSRHARMVLRSKEIEEEEQIEGLTLYALSLAAAMSMESPFLRETGQEEKTARRQAHRLFISPASDAISSLTALCYYRQASNGRQFCQRAFLNEKIMKEMAALERQLRQIFFKTFDLDCPKAIDVVQPEPSQQMIDHLRHCLLAGWCDHLAHHHQADVQRPKKPKHVLYRTQSRMEGAVHLHPLSAVSKSAPPFVVYVSAVQSSEKIYLHQVTRVEPQWIAESAQPLCTVQEPPEIHPAPFYDAKRDAVCSWHRVTYGRHGWCLPLLSIPSTQPETRISHFALALLSGHVFSSDAHTPWTQESLVMLPAYVASVEARCHKRLGMLLTTLQEHNIHSRQSLLSRWRDQQQFLSEELRLWTKPQFWPSWSSKWTSFLTSIL